MPEIIQLPIGALTPNQRNARTHSKKQTGTTILAAERIGRRAMAMEIDPLFVDVAIRRWQQATGKDAIRASDQAVFSDLDGSGRAQGVKIMRKLHRSQNEGEVYNNPPPTYE